MYLHIGGETSLSDRWIMAVIDMEQGTSGKHDLNHFLAAKEAEGRLEWSCEDLPRSLIICMDRVILSGMSPKVLRKRLEAGRAIAQAKAEAPGHVFFLDDDEKV